jgi:hypothetical protein
VSRRANITRHGYNHAPGGSDPIPGGGGGGAKKLLVCWGGALPTVAGTGLVWRIPYDSDGSTLTFTLARAFARVEAPYTTAVTFTLEHSSGGDIAFSASTITTVTIPVGDYETDVTGLSTTVSSGDLVRLVYTAVGSVSTNFQVELLGSE